MVWKTKILKIFCDIFNHHTFDYYHAKFHQNQSKFFLDILGPFLDHCAAKIFFSLILTKFCMVIVKSMVIKNIKKKFQNFCFLDHFSTVCANAHCDGKNFCCKIFHLQKKWHGANYSSVAVGVKKLVSSSKIENVF